MEAWNRKAPHSVGAYDPARTTAWSRQLAEAHDHLRGRLRQRQSDLGDDTADDRGVLTHCPFCSALTTHHEGEGDGLFAELLRGRPDV